MQDALKLVRAVNDRGLMQFRADGGIFINRSAC